MNISVNNMLDAGTLVHGKLPDIYWELELSGTEIKVLRYVYNHCLRLYNTLKIFPRGNDGSPRFWRGKERMAEDCGLSYPTFRKNVRHLYELGLVTSMDDEAGEGLYCIGLSTDFLNTYTANQTVKSFRLHNLLDLIAYIYDNTTVEILNLQEKLPSITNVIELTGTRVVGDFSGNGENSHSKQATGKLVRTPIKVSREPIMVGRHPIFITPEVTREQSLKERLKMLKGVRTPYERKILKIAEYYEYKCRQAIHSTGFKCLGKDFRNHKNWVFLERIYNLCQENNWDYQIYIDAQFDRVKYYPRKQPYPYLNQFNSEGAIKYYHNYMKDVSEKLSVDGDAKVKADKMRSVNQQIIEDVIKDCEGVSDYIERAAKRRANKGLTEQQLKMLYLSEHWMGLSISYLAVIPWFMTYLEQFPNEQYVIDLRDEIQAVRSNRKLLELTTEIVGKVEKQMEIPETLCL